MAEDLRKYKGDGVFFYEPVDAPESLKTSLRSDYANAGVAIPVSFFVGMGWNKRIDSSDFERAVQQAKSIILSAVRHEEEVLPQYLKYGQIWQPIAALEEGRGACQHKSALIAGLLRSVDIPARVVFHPNFHGAGNPHFWVEAFNKSSGVWKPIDTSPAKPVKKTQFVRLGKIVNLSESQAAELRAKGLVKEQPQMFAEKSGERLECFEHKTNLHFKERTSIRRYK